MRKVSIRTIAYFAFGKIAQVQNIDNVEKTLNVFVSFPRYVHFRFGIILNATVFTRECGWCCARYHYGERNRVVAYG